MFSKPPKKGALSDRVRTLADRKPPPLPEVTEPPRQHEQRPDRRAVFRHGAITFESGQSMRVAVTNISRTGARIEFYTNAELPQEFVLHEPTIPLRRRVRVVWQRDGRAGLKFID